MNEANVLIEDGAVELTFGDTTVAVRALNIESSVQWSKRVKRTMFEQARVGLDSMEQAQKLATEAERIDLFLGALGSGAGDEFLAVRDLLIEHSPTVLSADVVNRGSARQIVVAFKVLYDTENPTRLLAGVMTGA